MSLVQIFFLSSVNYFKICGLISLKLEKELAVVKKKINQDLEEGSHKMYSANHLVKLSTVGSGAFKFAALHILNQLPDVASANSLRPRFW